MTLGRLAKVENENTHGRTDGALPDEGEEDRRYRMLEQSLRDAPARGASSGAPCPPGLGRRSR
ncbi:MAG: hypothetical protein R3E53_22460 [Myxococcota bacterium]